VVRNILCTPNEACMIKYFILFCLIFFTVANIALCENSSAVNSPKWLALLTIIVAIFIPIPTFFLVIIPAIKRLSDRLRKKIMYRRKIKTEVDLIFESYSGKKRFYTDNRNDSVPLEVPDHDFNFFEKLDVLSKNAISFLSREERDYTHRLYEAFRKGSYNKVKRKNVIYKNSIFQIAELSDNFKEVLKEKLEDC
jgi:hypothetical protein